MEQPLNMRKPYLDIGGDEVVKEEESLGVHSHKYVILNNRFIHPDNFQILKGFCNQEIKCNLIFYSSL